MFEWKMEDMKLRESKWTENIRGYTSYRFSQDRTTSREDKIKFVNSMTGGQLSYILRLTDLWDKEKDTLPKDWAGNVKTISLIAWCKRNDSDKLIDISYRYGEFHLVGCTRYIYDANRCYHYDTYADLVDETFHRQLLKCLEQENQYFLTTDPYEIAKRRISEYNQKYHTTFDISLEFCGGNSIKVVPDNNSVYHPDISEEECKILLDSYEALETKIVELSKSAKDKFYTHKEKN